MRADRRAESSLGVFEGRINIQSKHGSKSTVLAFFLLFTTILLMSTDALPQLLEAKAHSDEKNYRMKHLLLSQMMRKNPDAFVVDSDNGKGIVGITHVPTGFKVHVPKHLALRDNVKSANLRDVFNNLRRIKNLDPARRGKFVGGQLQKGMLSSLNNTVDFLQNNPRADRALRKLTEHRLMDPANRPFHMRLGSYAGAPIGAISGAVTGDDAESATRNGIIGALVGAGAGAGAGRYLPRALQAGAGRVLTNLVDPHIYDSKLHIGSIVDGVRKAGVGGVLKSLWKDQPIHEIAPARHALFRDFFGLKRFKGTEDVFKDVGRDADGLRVLRHNVRDAGARADLRDIHSARLKTLTGDGSGRWMQQGKQTLTSGGSPGNFNVKPDGTWEDVWDFSLHKGQQINSPETLLRALVSPLGTPSKVVGKTLNESQMLRFSPMTAHRFRNIHPSFTDPVMNRAVRGAGIDSSQLQRFINSKLNAGEKAPVMRSIAQRASGKPYNLLQDLAKSENTTVSDVREFLGGAPRKSRIIRDRSPKWETGDLMAMFSSRIQGATPANVSELIGSMTPDQSAKLRKGLNAWTAGGRPAGGETAALASALGGTPKDLSDLLSMV